MSDQEIIKKLIYYLENDSEREKKELMFKLKELEFFPERSIAA